MFEIYTITKFYIIQVVDSLLKNQAQPDPSFPITCKILETALDLLHSILIFPYLLSILEFNSENRIESICVICLPDSFQDRFLDFDLFETVLQLITSNVLSPQFRTKCLRVLCKLPGARRTVSHDPELSDKFIVFIMKMFALLPAGDYGNDKEICIDEILDGVQRFFRVYTIEDMNRHMDSALPFFSVVFGLVESVFSMFYKIGSERAEQINDLMNYFLNYSVKKNDPQLSECILKTLRFYVETFFTIESNHFALLDEEILNHSDLKELKVAISASFKMFEESYHYIEEVKNLLHEQLSQTFFESFTKFISSQEINMNHRNQQYFLSRMIHFMYISVSSFLSFINVSSNDEFGFTSMVMHDIANREREIHIEKEGRILGILFELIHKFESLFVEEQLEIMIDVVLLF